jgi:RNA polymerase sigma-70 factor (ECF subfamily)
MRQKATYHEGEVLRLLKGGSELAFAQIFDRYRPQVYRTARQFLKSTELAEEIVQEVFLKLWLKRETMDEVERLDAFLFTIARNLTLDALRKLSHEIVAKKHFSSEASYSENTIDHALQETQYAELLEQAVALLPPQQKQVFHLAKVEGLSHEAIAEQLNISRLTVKAHMAKALQSIRTHLQPHLGTMSFLPFLFYKIFNF